MTVRFRRNPIERDDFGNVLDFEKTWVCFTMTVKNAPDERAATDAFDFIEWYLCEQADTPCALLRCAKCENGIYNDALTFERDKSMRKDVQYQVLKDLLREAKAAWYKELASAIPPFILAATRKSA